MLLTLRYHIPVSITTYHFSLPLFICIYQRNSLFQCASATLNNTVSKLCTRHATTKSSSCIAIGYICNQLQSKLSCIKYLKETKISVLKIISKHNHIKSITVQLKKQLHVYLFKKDCEQNHAERNSM